MYYHFPDSDFFFRRATAYTVLGVCRIFSCVFASTDNSCSILLPQVSISLRIIAILNLIIVIRNRGFKLSKSIAGVGTQLKITEIITMYSILVTRA